MTIKYALFYIIIILTGNGNDTAHSMANRWWLTTSVEVTVRCIKSWHYASKAINVLHFIEFTEPYLDHWWWAWSSANKNRPSLWSPRRYLSIPVIIRNEFRFPLSIRIRVNFPCQFTVKWMQCIALPSVNGHVALSYVLYCFWVASVFCV